MKYKDNVDTKALHLATNLKYSNFLDIKSLYNTLISFVFAVFQRTMHEGLMMKK